MLKRCKDVGMNRKRIINIIIILVLACAPLFLNTYWVDVLNNIGIYAILALSLNFILGHTGLFHMGHAAFYAIGAYTTAILNTMYHIPIIWLMPLSGLLAGIFGYLVARPIIHLRGDYLLIVTIGIVEIVRIALVNNIFGITGGSNGIFGISRPKLWGFVIRRPQDFFYYIWIFLGISVYLFYRLENSRFGRALNYIKEDDLAAEGSGVDSSGYKLKAFIIGAIWAGFVGNIYASKMTIISPESFSFWESVILFVIVILGGSGSMRGIILGSFLIIGLPELFRQFASARMLIFGAAMVVMMIFRPQGIIPPKPRTYNLDFLKLGEAGK
ncbi:MAG: branched-chain amino acid transport system permease protein [Desulfonauticus sp.]|nr:branched-chain amino acid transport system permease protein [Desulfonauticus sp.]